MAPPIDEKRRIGLRAWRFSEEAQRKNREKGQNPQLGLKRGTQPLERGFKHYYFT